MISIGDTAPTQSFPATPDTDIALSGFNKKKLVLYFYPRDNTPGCTTESQNFRDLYQEFLDANAVIIGASRDTLASHKRFQDKQELPFPLISDTDEVLCNIFDVIKQKNMYGKQVRGIERSTFLFDTQGILRQEWRKVKVKGHAEEILNAVKGMA